MLAIDLEQLRLQPASSPTELTSRLLELSERTNGISSRIYRLSHELRPAKLEALGLFATLLGYCEEVSELRRVTVTFTHQGKAGAIPAAVALCVYRITQEALHIVVHHRDATLARVHLAVDDGQLRLIIEHDGAGFDAASSSGGGLGLASMRERLHAVGGDLRIDSAVSGGGGSTSGYLSTVPNDRGSHDPAGPCQFY